MNPKTRRKCLPEWHGATVRVDCWFGAGEAENSAPQYEQPILDFAKKLARCIREGIIARRMAGGVGWGGATLLPVCSLASHKGQRSS